MPEIPASKTMIDSKTLTGSHSIMYQYPNEPVEYIGGEKGDSLNYARYRYFKNFDDNQLKDDYLRWVKRRDYCIFKNQDTGQLIAALASKRGNQIYHNRVMRRYAHLKKVTKELRRFAERSFTQVLWVSYTYAPPHTPDLWSRVGTDWNKYITRMRKAYGGIDVIRVFESTKKGNPHIHAILFFRERKFRVYRHYSKQDKKWKWRVPENRELQKHWVHGYSDNQGVTVLERIMRYIMKYLSKQLKNIDDNALLLARMWVYRKRSYSISRNILDLKLKYTLDLPINSIIQTKESWILIGIWNIEYDLTGRTILAVNDLGQEVDLLLLDDIKRGLELYL